MQIDSTASTAFTLGYRFTAPACPHCGELLVAPTAAAFAGPDDIRHLWACDECGFAFRTSVRLRAPARRTVPTSRNRC